MPSAATRNSAEPRTHPGRSFGYNGALDGLRAIAVAGVVALHTKTPLTGGFHGVTVFFVISGYLITSLLIHEYAQQGRVRLGEFYRRRFARLAPALLLVVAVSTLYLIIIQQPVGKYWAGILGSLSYSTDLIEPFFGNAAVSTFFQWSWSLAVEEQFYLLWPVLLVAMLRRLPARPSRMIGYVLLLVAATWAVRALQGMIPASHEAATKSPWVHADALLLGAALAIALALLSSVARRRTRAAARALGPLGAVCLAWLFLAPGGFPPLRAVDPGAYGQTALCSLAVVAWVTTMPEGRFARVLAWRPLAFLGQLSYGIYLWNMLLILAFKELFGVKPAQSWWGFLWLVALLVICYLSWRFVETPLRRRWAPPSATSASQSAKAPIAAPESKTFSR